MLSKVRSILSKARLAGRPAMRYPGNTDTDKRLDIQEINDLKDEELEILNSLLPWAAFVLDKQGRNFGQAYSPKKRNEPQAIPDRRIIELDRRYGLAGKYVLEAGCFEGIHTVGLIQQGASVSAFDGRIENVIKTLVRCWAFDVYANVFFWNLEEDRPAHAPIECDILHHVGVLYHLMDPIGHLATVLPSVRQAVMLDTHIAPEGAGTPHESAGFEYRYTNFKEAGRTPPFAGLGDHAKWVALDDLVAFLKHSGFGNVDVAERRDERNGLRALIFAHR